MRKSGPSLALTKYEYYPNPALNHVTPEGYTPKHDDFKWMGKSLERAKEAIGRDTPVGAVLIDMVTDSMVASSHSKDHITGDPRKHAEDVMIDEALEAGYGNDFSRAVVYTTLIPCNRCAQVLSDFRLGMLFYGADYSDSAIHREREFGPHQVAWPEAHRRLTVVAGLLAVEAAALLIPENRAPGASRFSVPE